MVWRCDVGLGARGGTVNSVKFISRVPIEKNTQDIVMDICDKTFYLSSHVAYRESLNVTR